MFKVGKPSDKPESPTYFWLEEIVSHAGKDGVRLVASYRGVTKPVLDITNEGVRRWRAADLCKSYLVDDIQGRIVIAKDQGVMAGNVEEGTLVSCKGTYPSE